MKNKDQKLQMLVIEGNVGVGKSTFLKYLQKNLNADVIYEPNELWQNVDGYNLLNQFFLDPHRWAYTCQSYVLLTRMDQVLAELCDQSKQYCLIERSVYSGRYCFAKVAQEIGWMNPMEWVLYQKLWDREVQRVHQLPSAFIYLRTSAEICFQRIEQRGRFEEKPITLQYLKQIEEKYDNWFIKKQGIDQKIASIPVLVLDFSADLAKDQEMQNRSLVKIQEFIATL